MPDQPLDLNAIKARAAAAIEGPWHAHDCEGRLELWREGALTHVSRGDDGEIVGYSLPASYYSTDQIVEWDDLETWDRGVEGAEDQLRDTAEFIARARTDVPALAAEVERLRALLSVYAVDPDGNYPGTPANQALTENVLLRAEREEWRGQQMAAAEVLGRWTRALRSPESDPAYSGAAILNDIRRAIGAEAP